MENFVFPDEIKTILMKMSKKPICLLPHHSYMKTWIKLETTYKPPQGPQDFSKVAFFAFEPANFESIGDNHTVSDFVFKVTRII